MNDNWHKMGEYYLKIFGFQTDKSRIRLEMIVLVGLYFFVIMLACLLLKYNIRDP